MPCIASRDILHALFHDVLDLGFLIVCQIQLGHHLPHLLHRGHPARSAAPAAAARASLGRCTQRHNRQG